MFYSHEVLTNSRYGVATVWLVATLGADSARKKVNRSEILSVNVPKACETITSNETPLALRLQSNLLFGVSKVYSQQCTFVLTDAEHVRIQVRNAMNALRASQTTSTKSHVAKRDHITVRDESQLALHPDLEYMPGLPRLGLEFISNGVVMVDSQTFSLDPDISQRSLYKTPEPSTEQLIIPSEDGFAMDLDRRISSGIPASSISGGRHTGSVRLGSHFFDLEPPRSAGVLEDVGLNIDPDGNIFEGPPLTEPETGPVLQANIQVVDENFVQHHPPVDDFVFPHDLDILENARPFTPLAPSSEHPLMLEESIEIPPEDSSSVQVAAPSRAHRRHRVMPLDNEMEISHTEISLMSNQYLQNMHQASEVKFHRGGLALAHRNARFWVMGNADSAIGLTRLAPELQLFTGANLLDALAAPHEQPSPQSTKRSSSASDEDRRVRPRLSGSEAGRADPDLPGQGLDDIPLYEDHSLELGRELGTPLADHRSSTLHMPWNTRSSSRVFSAPRLFAVSSVAGRGGSAAIRASSHGVRAGSSVASPLAGLPRSLELSEGHDAGLTFELDQGPVHDLPGAGEQAGSSWLSQSQDPESANFLDFVREKVEEQRVQDGQEEGLDGVEFEHILPPQMHDRVVAAHALMHVLSLVGKDVLRVAQGQEVAFMPIVLGLI